MTITKNKKYKITIPSKINLYYCKKKKILILKGAASQKSLKIKINIKIKKNKIKVISLLVKNVLQKKLKALYGSVVILIKQLLINVRSVSYKNLNFVGIGYKAYFVENNLILLKLGYSHFIYFNIPVNLKVSCLKLTRLFIKGSCYNNVTAAASRIRAKKLPEVYKGKGILYKNEKIKLKEGKKKV